MTGLTERESRRSSTVDEKLRHVRLWTMQDLAEKKMK